MKFIYLILLTVVLMFSGCGGSNLCITQEIDRRPSPDDLVEAVLLKSDCGATTDYSYRVYIVPVGGEPTEKHLIFLADKVEKINVSWLDQRELKIAYDNARIFQFRNFSQPLEAEGVEYAISISDTEKN
ncbi:MAG: hypothetical protein ACI92B_000553 [Marinobacter maritimus]|jgi:hypothetical protein